MKIPISEIFESIQFEGSQHGTPALFIRLSGCNLWNGKENDRNKGAGNCALYCDTDFNYKFSLNISELKTIIYDYCEGVYCNPLVIFTGGEPTLHNNKLIDLFIELLDDDIKVSIETNGTSDCSITKLLLSHSNGHVTMSPKKDRNDSYKHIQLKRSDDLKLIFPHNADFDHKNYVAANWFIQLESGNDNGKKYLVDAIQFLKEHPIFKLSTQTHKFLGLR